MGFKIFLLALSVSGVSVGEALGQVPYSLPKSHLAVVERQLASGDVVVSPFERDACSQVALRSPFSEEYLASVAAGDYAASSGDQLAGKMVDYARRFLGTRYRLGASGPKAFDCSGFTSYVYKNFGITLNRSSRSQFLQGERVAVNQLQPGDLLFFSSRSAGRGNVGHVAMVVSVDRETGTCQFIHASTKKGVTYQVFPDGGYYQRHYLGARRILGTALDSTADIACY